MNRGKHNFFAGTCSGLPATTSHTPFGHESSWFDEFGLLESQVRVVVAVLAAEAAGLGPVCQQDIEQVCPIYYLSKLERLGWIECAGKVPRSNTKIWRGTKKAWRVLGLAGWRLEGAA